jgi:hypothetical protein
MSGARPPRYVEKSSAEPVAFSLATKTSLEKKSHWQALWKAPAVTGKSLELVRPAGGRDAAAAADADDTAPAQIRRVEQGATVGTHLGDKGVRGRAERVRRLRAGLKRSRRHRKIGRARLAGHVSRAGRIHGDGGGRIVARTSEEGAIVEAAGGRETAQERIGAPAQRGLKRVHRREIERARRTGQVDASGAVDGDAPHFLDAVAAKVYGVEHRTVRGHFRKEDVRIDASELDQVPEHRSGDVAVSGGVNGDASGLNGLIPAHIDGRRGRAGLEAEDSEDR